MTTDEKVKPKYEIIGVWCLTCRVWVDSETIVGAEAGRCPTCNAFLAFRKEASE